ncbi:MAG: 4-hydroxy-3-methylbut-2-enyl diphosphate reductase [Phycisphaerales bacterium]|jgi:4-hydroxy-3-methylbut-2-en-1-yl diphosphate reductase|nr:4-hydroxy-3-methylbut-2-enyl diphosphate reductase [Phycisphaerales bacterium]MBT7171987.1 4-hydroxy-3-methylbut-2-enyl diphosphate reductase [Phycisphaerales bacterium]
MNPHDAHLDAFGSPVVDRLLAATPANQWSLPGGTLRLPRVFGFCRGVKRALSMAEQAASLHDPNKGRLILLGEIIHNPWVNDHFRRLGGTILLPEQRKPKNIDKHLSANDTAVIPAFGAGVATEAHLKQLGCEVVDCSCGDVIRLWHWSTHAVKDGFGVLIFGKPRHDETVVTKSRLDQAGGKFIVAESIDKVHDFANLIATGNDSPERFAELFDPDATNAQSPADLAHLAQVSQTTMLYSHTEEVRQILTDAFTTRFGEIEQRLIFQPTVCRATQDRQNAAVELCQSGCDLVIVVGGHTSSNTRHLYELARQFAPAYHIEDATAIRSRETIFAWDPANGHATEQTGWLPQKRPLNIAILAGASSPEIVIGEVLQTLAEFLQ